MTKVQSLPHYMKCVYYKIIEYFTTNKFISNSLSPLLRDRGILILYYSVYLILLCVIVFGMLNVCMYVCYVDMHV